MLPRFPVIAAILWVGTLFKIQLSANEWTGKVESSFAARFEPARRLRVLQDPGA